MGEQGRPTKYKTEYDEQAYKLCLLGLTNVDLANYFEVNKTTITEWINNHDSFSTAVKSGRIPADANVAASLNKRARGFQYTEETKELDTDGNLIVTKQVTKEVPPDTGAAMAWLKNRRPKDWRDKQEVQVDAHNVNENITSLADLLNDPVKDREIPGDD